MKDTSVAKPGTTEWALPIVFVPKKDGIIHFCADYRRLNAVSERDSYPIPRIGKCIDSLGEGQTFPTFEANSWYGQIERDRNDIDKTVFVTNHELFIYTRVPFRLKNGPVLGN